MGARFFKIIVIGLFSFIFYTAARGQVAGSNYALLIAGLGGEERYSERFFRYLRETKRALIEEFGYPAENVIALAETRYQDENVVDGISNAETIEQSFAVLAGKSTPQNDVFIFLFGHGSYDGGGAKLNIPRRDLSDGNYATLVNSLRARRIIFINTASASAPFVGALSAQNRIIITATAKATQRNVTEFPEFFVKGLSDPETDLDKDGVMSVRELFTFAAQSTARFYREKNHLATEFAQLEDTGDGKAVRVTELGERGEGALAASTYFRRYSSIAGAVSPQDSLLVGLLAEKERLEGEIAVLKSQKDRYSEDVYYEQLESLLISLATLNERIEKLKFP